MFIRLQVHSAIEILNVKGKRTLHVMQSMKYCNEGFGKEHFDLIIFPTPQEIESVKQSLIYDPILKVHAQPIVEPC